MKILGIDSTQCLFGGHWQASLSGETIALSNPSDGSEHCQIARGGPEDIEAAVAAAAAALTGDWGRATAAERGRLLAKLGQLVLANVDELARLEALDVGKPLTQARADAVALARYMEFCAGAAEKLHGQTIPYLDGYTVYRCANRMA